MTRVSKQTVHERHSLEEQRREAAYACLMLSVLLISQQSASVSTWCWFSKATDEIPGSIKGLFGGSLTTSLTSTLEGSFGHLNVRRI